MTDAYVLDYVRTPRGKASKTGALHDVAPLDLLILLQNALVARGLDPAAVEDVIIGCASQVGEQGGNIARTATILAGWGDGVPGATVNRFCASGIDAVAQAAARVRVGELDLAVAGGVESVSRVPMFSDEAPLWRDPEVIRQVGSVHMGISADLNATIDGFKRDELDAYAVETQHKAAQAWQERRFDGSVVKVPVADGRSVVFDELVRPGTSTESLAALPPAFATFGAQGQDAMALRRYPEVAQIEHLHTVGTSPAMADAAALTVIASSSAAETLGARPRARVVGSATFSVDPILMLTAGQAAVERVVARAGLTPADIDVFEFAEAFAALCLRFRRDLDAGPDRMNPNGGTMAMGHAFGATGAILVGDCVAELERRDGRYGVAAVSGAAGLGVALLLERTSN